MRSSVCAAIGLAALLSVAVVLGGCQESARIGASCERAADCAAPLVCSLGRCHEQCREARDCPVGARCVAAPGGGVCSLDSENHCDTHVCPAPLVCVTDECRSTCSSSTECVTGPCSSATCMEPESGYDGGVGADSAAADASSSPDALDAEGALDASRDAWPGTDAVGIDVGSSDAAGRDAIAPDGGLRSCDAIYSGASGYMLCMMSSSDCTFAENRNNTSCDEVCMPLGATCTAAAYPLPTHPCNPSASVSCSTQAGGLICTCSRVF